MIIGFLPRDGSILIGGINAYFVSVVLVLHGYDKSSVHEHLQKM